MEAYAIFQTNDSSISVEDLETDRDVIKAASGTPVQSFNFAFATCMYDSWRLIDLLV